MHTDARIGGDEREGTEGSLMSGWAGQAKAGGAKLLSELETG